ncbi:PspC domain-containing protein [Gracilibacillus thailandensis]|uniref:PspC domain-containing protein n=1 Tax=Gracilibacillus thailandensis TaxID=563735 RepID=UPI001E5123A7|nr:PspC domain-containing protein [Gracilibacillus thailandensis]
MRRRLRKSGSDRSVHGVCGGIAEYFGISSFLVRLLFLFVMSGFYYLYHFIKYSPRFAENFVISERSRI